MKGFIVYPDSINVDGKTFVRLFGRLENGESFVCVNSFEPYLFILREDEKKFKEVFENDLGTAKIESTKLINFNGEAVSKIIFQDQAELNKFSKKLHEKDIQTFEGDIKPEYRFMMDNDIRGFVDIDGDFESEEKVQRVYGEASVKKIAPIENFKLKTVSIDIETGKDGLYCVGLYSENIKKVFMVTKYEIDGVVSCKDEEDCLEKFKEELISIDPDIITGWNVIDFDFNYLKSLFQKHKISFDFGRTNENVTLRIEDNFFRSSKMDVPGRVVLDGLGLIRDPFIKEAPSIKNIKFESYTLGDVSSQILGKTKLIIGKDRCEEIEELFHGSKKDNARLVEYNLMDCQLVYEILEKTKMIDLEIERSGLVGMPLDRLTGSVASFDSLYIRESRKRGLVSPTNRFGSKDNKITGAFVMTPNPGLYHNVLVLDFKSLYPSIIKTFNIDPASFSDKRVSGYIESPNGAFFKNEEGILPSIIHSLHEAREIAKKEKRELSSYAIKIIMNSFFGVLASPNCRYFNLKMGSAITSFGQEIIKMTAVEIEKMGYKVIYGDSVSGDTEVIIKKDGKILKEDIENLFKKIDKENEGKEYDFKNNTEVLTLDCDGKSVFKPIKYVMRHKTNKKMFRVNFTNNWHIDVTEDHSLIGYQSLEFNNKKEYGQDFLQRLIEVRPEEIGKKTRTIVSLKKIPIEKEETKNFSKEVYEFLGYFVGDGSFKRNSFQKKANKDYYLCISTGSDTEEILKRLLIPLMEQGYIKNYWLSKTRKGDVTINGLKLINIVSTYFRDSRGAKTIPSWLFEEEDGNISSFLRGLFSADGCVLIRNKSPIIKYTSIENDYIEKIRKLLYRIGISHSAFKENSINKYKTKEKIFCSGSYSKNIIIQSKDIFCEKVGFILERKNKRANTKTDPLQKRNIKKFEFDTQGVKNIEEIKTPDYVYDLEVEDTHRFFANYVLVHNTDSVFVMNEEDNKNSEKTGYEISDKIDTFYEKYVRDNFNRKSYLDLEFDKLYLALIMPKTRIQLKNGDDNRGAKKRYAGLIEKDGKEELDIVGLEAVRGDWTDVAQEFQRELLLKIFKKEDCVVFIRNRIKEINAGKLDKKLVYRKSIRKDLEEYTKTTPPHVKAARKLDKLEGNVIEYLVTLDGPEPIQKLKHKIDYKHYIDKQIKPIAKTILDTMGLDFENILEGTRQKKLF